MRPKSTTGCSGRLRCARAARISARTILLGLVLTACKQDVETKPQSPPLLGGWYRAVLKSSEGDEVPFYLSLPDDPTKGGAVIQNGKHWFSAEHHWTGERVEIDFAMYRTKILATVGENRSLVGTWESASKAWGTASLPFRATKVDAPDPELKLRNASSPAPEIDPSGVWKLKFERSGLGKLVIAKEGPTEIGATLWYNGGETIYLSGNLIGTQARLSAFDGTSPYSLLLDVEREKIAGQWITAADLSYREELKGARVPKDFELPEPVSVTSADHRLRLPELEHPRYAGHPVIVMIAGSWCSHCKSAAPVLANLYDRHQDQELRILTINYEFTDDKSYNLQRATQFKNEYGITWQLVTRDGGLEEFWHIVPSGLSGEGLAPFPIVIFLRRDGTVHQLHSGFLGPESGAAHEQLVQLFETWTKEILR